MVADSHISVEALHLIQLACVQLAKYEECGHSCRLHMGSILLPKFAATTASFLFDRNNPGLPGHNDAVNLIDLLPIRC